METMPRVDDDLYASCRSLYRWRLFDMALIGWCGVWMLISILDNSSGLFIYMYGISIVPIYLILYTSPAVRLYYLGSIQRGLLGMSKRSQKKLIQKINQDFLVCKYHPSDQ